MNFTDLRLKIRHFIRKYKNIILIALCIWLIIFIINIVMLNKKPDMTPSTTLETHTSIMDSTEKVPTNVKNDVEELIKNYVDACNDGNYQKAFNYLSADCREFGYHNDVKEFMQHVLNVMPTPKKYSIQDYSNITLPDGKDIYIYEIKYYDDYLATGLTNSDYSFSSEKLTFYRDDDNDLMMNAGDYIYHSDPDSITENDYLKVDIQDRMVEYKTETYQVLFTNRSNYTVVISDEEELEEVCLLLDNDANETRGMQELDHIVLGPGESKTVTLSFQKFVDDGDTSKALLLKHVRVMEKYSGTENVDPEVIKSEKDNAIAKLSVNVNIAK